MVTTITVACFDIARLDALGRLVAVIFFASDNQILAVTCIQSEEHLLSLLSIKCKRL